jgi:hypothetical protein
MGRFMPSTELFATFHAKVCVRVEGSGALTPVAQCKLVVGIGA